MDSPPEKPRERIEVIRRFFELLDLYYAGEVPGSAVDRFVLDNLDAFERISFEELARAALRGHMVHEAREFRWRELWRLRKAPPSVVVVVRSGGRVETVLREDWVYVVEVVYRTPKGWARKIAVAEARVEEKLA